MTLTLYNFMDLYSFDMAFGTTAGLFWDPTWSWSNFEYDIIAKTIKDALWNVILTNQTFDQFIDYVISVIPSQYNASLVNKIVSYSSMQSTVIVKMNKLAYDDLVKWYTADNVFNLSYYCC